MQKEGCGEEMRIYLGDGLKGYGHVLVVACIA